ncbi:MAG: DUF2384 domain-containing protein [Gammaproteobacteria bacterium]|nr:DUF2384 domain-containing protein [Gammaproteobacteria bacterium]
MTTEKNHITTKTTKQKTPIPSRMQKKDIHALLQQAEDNDDLIPITETLKGRVIFRTKDIRTIGKLKRRAERNSFIHEVLINRIKDGIEATAFEMVTKAYDIPMSEGYKLMGIPQSTLRRRLNKGKLLPNESDRVYRYAELMTKATEMMQKDSNRAASWFKKPMEIFGGETPLQHAITEIGAREVEDLIGRIRHGVFS